MKEPLKAYWTPPNQDPTSTHSLKSSELTKKATAALSTDRNIFALENGALFPIVSASDFNDPDLRLRVLPSVEEGAQTARPLELMGPPVGLELTWCNSYPRFWIDWPAMREG